MGSSQGSKKNPSKDGKPRRQKPTTKPPKTPASEASSSQAKISERTRKSAGKKIRGATPDCHRGEGITAQATSAVVGGSGNSLKVTSPQPSNNASLRSAMTVDGGYGASATPVAGGTGLLRRRAAGSQPPYPASPEAGLSRRHPPPGRSALGPAQGPGSPDTPTLDGDHNDDEEYDDEALIGMGIDDDQFDNMSTAPNAGTPPWSNRNNEMTNHVPIANVPDDTERPQVPSEYLDPRMASFDGVQARYGTGTSGVILPWPESHYARYDGAAAPQSYIPDTEYQDEHLAAQDQVHGQMSEGEWTSQFQSIGSHFSEHTGYDNNSINNNNHSFSSPYGNNEGNEGAGY